jgi:redox-sensitive bicupin YhaK (pirin superfamily)
MIVTKRTLSTVMELKTDRRNSTFTVRGVRFQVGLDPFLNVDLFELTGPVFAPHPHAGYSAVTYVFDDSTTRVPQPRQSRRQQPHRARRPALDSYRVRHCA